MTRRSFATLFYLILLCCACGRSGRPDAYGIIDAHSWMVAASEAGQIVDLQAEEGLRVARGTLTVQLDTAALDLQLKALESQIRALLPTLPDVSRQLDVLYRQKESLVNERTKLATLVASGTASSGQLDKLDDQIRVVDSQISAARSSMSRETAAVMANIESLRSQADIVRDRIARCAVKNPEDGTVTELFAHLHEFVAPGQPVYKLSDLEHLYVDAWLDGGTLSRVALGDAVEVKVDDGARALRPVSGRITYIAGEAEFTPNRVLTRDTRVTMVYHVRIELAEGGPLRPGMPAEIFLAAK